MDEKKVAVIVLGHGSATGFDDGDGTQIDWPSLGFAKLLIDLREKGYTHCKDEGSNNLTEL